MSERPAGTVYYRRQLCRDGIDVTGYGLTLEDVDEIRFWSGAHGDQLIAALEATGTGRWRFASSDLYGRLLPGECVTFSTPERALQYLGFRIDAVLVKAACRCDQPGGQCD